MPRIVDRAIPGEEDIAKLPRWAQVAFAARCARRVFGLLQFQWDRMLKDSTASARVRPTPALIERYLTHAESTAATGTGDSSSFPNPVRDGNVAWFVEHDMLSGDVAFAAAYAVMATNQGILGRSVDYRESALKAMESSLAAVTRVTSLPWFGPERAKAWKPGCVRAIRHDVDSLRLAAEREGWTDDTLVPPEFFGPLWPDGELEGWPKKEVEPKQSPTTLPKSDEIAKLPRRALVAFAARCARRVQPLYKAVWPDAADEALVALDGAISLAEASASTEDASELATLGLTDNDGDGPAARIAYAAGHNGAMQVGRSAEAAARAASTEGSAIAIAATGAARFALLAARDCHMVLPPGVPAHHAAMAAMWHDIEMLTSAADRGEWTDETPVSPTFFGPMWPYGAPEGWPKDSRESKPSATDPVTKEEIATLPRWAQVAFAARCARRVQPLFKHSWPNAPNRHFEALYAALEIAEGSAASASLVPCLTATTVTEAHNAVHWAHDAGNAAGDVQAAKYAAFAAYDAVTAASHARQKSALTHIPEAVAYAVQHAVAAADGLLPDVAPGAASQAAHAVMRRDLDLLKAAAERDYWTDDTRVAPTFFGPMWPGGEPDGWPTVADMGETNEAAVIEGGSTLSLYFDLDEFSPTDITEFIDGLSTLYAEIGGDELIIDDARILEVALIPEGVW